MVKVLISGIRGKMGENLTEILKGDKDAEIICGVDQKKGDPLSVPVYEKFSSVTEKPDVIIDFSAPLFCPIYFRLQK